MTDQSKSRRWPRLLGAIALVFAGMISGVMSTESAPTFWRVSLFVAGVAALVLALRPHYAIALWLGGFLALGKGHGLDAWNLTALCLSGGAPFLALRTGGAYVSVAASVPFWILANEAPWLVNVAPAVLIAGPVWYFWRLLVTTRRPVAMRGRTPDPRLANGPLVHVPARSFGFDRGLRALRALVLVFAIGCIAGVVLGLRGNEDATALGLASGVVALCFAFAIWLNSRSRYCVDARGLARRLLVREERIAWSDVTDLFVRGVQLRMTYNRMEYTYYGVGSPTREIAFPHTLAGAAELRGIIERATGLRFEDAMSDADPTARNDPAVALVDSQ